MRRIGRVAGLFFLLCSFAILYAVLMTGRAVEAAQRSPALLCLDQRELAAIRSGSLPLGHKDRLVTTSANFAAGRTGMSTWHLRGATIHVAYRSFWSRRQRSAIFDRVAAGMRPCPPRRRPLTTG